MNPPVTAPARPACPAQTLAARVAALLPERAGLGWSVEPYNAWWSTRPAARLVQGDRALILVVHSWRTEIGWQLPDREPCPTSASTGSPPSRSRGRCCAWCCPLSTTRPPGVPSPTDPV